MKSNLVKWLSVIGAVAVSAASAQETNEVEQLKREMREMREQMRRMEQKLETIEQKPPVAAVGPAEKPVAVAPPVEPSASSVTKPWSPSDPIRVGKGGTYAEIGLVGTFAAGGSTANDIQGGTQLGGHDPNQNGFTVQGVEMNLQGAVDPYFRANANILFSIDAGGESFLEVEEAWMETVSLPWNLQLRAGEILTDFGRINTQHPHSWGFVDSPLVGARLLGPDGLRNPGARLAWLAPTPFYTELSVGIQDSQGEHASSFRNSDANHGELGTDALPPDNAGLPYGYRNAVNDRGVNGLGDLLITPRLTTSFELTDSQTLVLGGSAALGPNSSGSSGDTMTQVYGLDIYWKWKPANAHGGFPFVSFQTEPMVMRYQLGAYDWDLNGNGAADPGELVNPATGLPAVLSRETVTDWGFYSQVLYGFTKNWVAGLRGDYVTGSLGNYEQLALTLDGNPVGRDQLRRERWRLSPNLTWYPSEFSKIRLQYNYDNRADLGIDHSVWLQFEFLLGAHAAHKF
ncbi:MAG: TonB-dependent receptor [Verrucomicrobiota bacterium]